MPNDDMDKIRTALLFNCGSLFPDISPETLDEFEKVFSENKAVNEIVTRLYDIIVSVNSTSIKNWRCINYVAELYKNNDVELHEYMNCLDAFLSKCNKSNIN
ncbi:MAG: hypothetical protein VR69_00225 [Peptococcaceae bacterium BRH_c4b]|nr:MAG: hypothetical protein VR69_00225 [Peptococcaceae bacterium BRH_c4b]